MHRKASTTAASAKAAENQAVNETAVNEFAAKAEKKTYRPKVTLSPTTMITVRNGFNGMLVYKSSKTGERFVWNGFGDEQDMELQELRNAKNSKKAFFENNWFMISDPEVIEYLGVERYYKNALSFENFDDLFSLTPEAIKNKIALLSSGQKATVVYRAKQLIADGTIDSIKVITALEESLGIELIER